MPCRAATRAPPGSASARRATSSSPAATRISPSARKPGRRTSRKKEALCARAEELADVARVGSRRLRDAAPAGGVEDRRTGAAQQVGGHLAALPRRRRHLLRSLQAARRDRARGQAGRSRGAHRRARSAGRRPEAEGAGDRPGRPPRTRAVAAHALEPDHLRRAPGRGSSERALRRRARARDGQRTRISSAAPSSIRRQPPARWRSWSRRSRAS